MFCMTCGKQKEHGALSCHHCGAGQSASSRPTETAATARANHCSIGLMGAIGLFGILPGALFGLFIAAVLLEGRLPNKGLFPSPARIDAETKEASSKLGFPY